MSSARVASRTLPSAIIVFATIGLTLFGIQYPAANAHGATMASAALLAPSFAATDSFPGGEDPSLEVMNAAHNHSMGSTIPKTSSSGQPQARLFVAQTQSVSQPPGTPGLDVSAWQVLSLADWTRAYANGARFVYIKATEGTDYVSSQYAEQYNDSRAAGLIRGAYHFATPNTSSGAAQANFFVTNGGGWSADGWTLPPMLDIEYNPYGDTCYGMAGSAMVSWIRDFSNTVLARTGRLPAIYSTTDWWTRCTGNTSAFSANPLFIARYPSNIASGAGTLPAGWNSYTFWQYADSGIYPGDQDVFNGNVSQLATTASTQSAWRPSPIIGPGDLNGDGKPDILATKPDGTLWYYAGTGTGSAVAAGGRVVGSGWTMFSQVVGPGDLNGDGKPDLLAVTPSGGLSFYAGTGTTGSSSNPAGLLAGVTVGSGWNMYSQIVTPGDLNGDGKPDVLGVTADGTLVFYAGTGTTGNNGSAGLKAGQIVGSGWNMFTQIVGTGDLNSDGHPDLVGATSSGLLQFYAGTGRTGSGNDSGFLGGATIGSGWNMFSQIIAPGDLTGDRHADLLGETPSGDLDLYAGTGSTGMTNDVSGLNGGSVIGSGWSTFTRVSGGDLNSDGKPDILGVDQSGSLGFYAGTGSTGSSGNPAGLSPEIVMGSGWNGFDTSFIAGDLNGDRKSDLLACSPDGTLVYYAGMGTTGSDRQTAGLKGGVTVGSGWNMFSKVVAAGDLNGDGKPDILGITPSGSLLFYAGTGTTGTSSNPAGLRPGITVGSGWNMFSKVVAAGDLNGDGKPDILGITPSGSLLFYAGTGTTGIVVDPSGLSAGSTVGTGWNVFG